MSDIGTIKGVTFVTNGNQNLEILLTVQLGSDFYISGIYLNFYVLFLYHLWTIIGQEKGYLLLKSKCNLSVKGV